MRWFGRMERSCQNVKKEDGTQSIVTFPTTENYGFVKPFPGTENRRLISSNLDHLDQVLFDLNQRIESLERSR